MVAELKMDDGHWEAFMADRLPTELDDEIKKSRAAFVNASKLMDPEEVKSLMPISFPMTHVLPGQEYMAIARYPIDEWMASGQPILSTIKLCLKIAEKDLENLQSVFDTAVKCEKHEQKMIDAGKSRL